MAETVAKKPRAPAKAKKVRRPRQLRHENKTRLTAGQQAILRVAAAGTMIRDPYAGPDGTYIVRSVYFDDLNDTCLRESVYGTDFRSKYRIRYYSDKTGRILLEKKTKVHGLGYKDACLLTREECGMMLSGLIPDPAPDATRRKKALLTEMRLRSMVPRVIVTYERMPLIYEVGNVRVTFDDKITSSQDFEHFLSGDYVQRPVLPTGECVLEVKWDDFLPPHIKDALRTEFLQWSAFSKYRACRTYHL